MRNLPGSRLGARGPTKLGAKRVSEREEYLRLFHEPEGEEGLKSSCDCDCCNHMGANVVRISSSTISSEPEPDPAPARSASAIDNYTFNS